MNLLKEKIPLILFFLVFSSNLIFADEKMELGLDIFNNKAQCGMCHTLKAAESEGQIGANLDELKPTLSRIIYAVTNGIGVMPAFEGMLTIEEIETVAKYVYNSTNK